MSTDDPFIPPKKKLNVLWWVGGAILLIVFLFFFQLLGPSPPIIVSKQTTHITEPLLPSGLPNYEEFIRRQLSAGVTPENNAAVLLTQALWPCDYQPADYKAVLKELGIHQIPSTENALQPMYGKRLLKQVAALLPQPSDDDLERDLEPNAEAVVDAARYHPWTSAQLPPLAEWVQANEAPLDLIVQASHRPRYYSPSPTLLDDRHDMLISIMLPGVQAVRHGARGLQLRAMQRIGENRPDLAWQDTLALYRLSRLVTQGPTLVEQLVAVALRGMAVHTTTAILTQGDLPIDLARQIQKDLAAIQPLDNMARGVDQMERLCCLDTVVHVKTYGLRQLGDHGGSTPIDYISVDWNVALEKLNKLFDQAAAAMQQPPGEERERALDQLNATISADTVNIRTPGRLIPAIISRGARSDVAGSMIQELLLPALNAASTAESRINSQLQLIQVAAALAVFHAEHGTYPEKLEELVPGALVVPPADAFHGKPLVYKRLKQGYLLYSLGQNGQDDGGSNSMQSTFEGLSTEHLNADETGKLLEKIPQNSDDISIRLPVAPFTMPKPPATEAE